ncbi:MAG: hypothetical protein SXG53_04795 [Pseudomonadota bacterium]|nr:hypothetical protein [Pseudomonadota bacterium]
MKLANRFRCIFFDRDYVAKHYSVDVTADAWSDAKKVARFVEQFKGKVYKGKGAAKEVRQVSEVFDLLFHDKGIGQLARGVGSVAAKIEKGLGATSKWAGKVTGPIGKIRDARDLAVETYNAAHENDPTGEQIDEMFDPNNPEAAEQKLRSQSLTGHSVVSVTGQPEQRTRWTRTLLTRKIQRRSFTIRKSE